MEVSEQIALFTRVVELAVEQFERDTGLEVRVVTVTHPLEVRVLVGMGREVDPTDPNGTQRR